MKKKIIKALSVYYFVIYGLFSSIASANSKDHIDNIVKNTNLNAKIVKLALQAYQYANFHSQVKKQVLTIVDYSQPSKAKRLYVIDLKTDKLLINTWVAHGKNTGELMSTQFSNQPESLQSSIGVFITEGVYLGHHGISMVLNGLEKNLNNNAKERRLVVHGAPYVSEAFLKMTGRMGRSFGCLAVNPEELPHLIEVTKDGSVIFSYAPAEDHDRILYS